MERSLARSNAYDILSRCFTYPDEKIYSWISEGEWLMKLRDSLNLLADDNFEGYLIAFEEVIDGKQKAIQPEMAREYARYFIIAFPPVIDPPHGSIYLEKGELVLGKMDNEELRFFHEAGLTLREDLGDLSDHIASKLKFMGILADQESRVSGGEKIRLEEVQLAFLSRYISPWVPTFCEKVTKQNALPFYCVLGELTREFISFEKDYLGFTEEIDSSKDLKSERPWRFI
jgi:TorA maturation chaperone TorD